MKYTGIIIAAIAIASVIALVMPTNTIAQSNQTNGNNNNTGTPILGGIANLNTVQDEGKISFTITKNTAANETTVISQNGTVTEVPGGNVTVVDNGTVVVAPDNSTVSTTPTNVTVIEPPKNETTAPVQPCQCNQTNQNQSTIPNVIVTPAPGQNVTTQETPVPVPVPVPMPPISNVTNPSGNETNPPAPTGNITGNGGVVGPEAGGNTTNPTNPLIPGTS